jgi:phage baseplate assembly protein W
MTEPTIAPDALVTQFDPASGQFVVIQGGPQQSDTYSALNTLTPTQYAFLARRQMGADGALPQSRVGRFTGPAYQFGPSWALTLGPKTDLEVVFTSIANIITTPIGSLPYDPFGGSEIPNLVFEPNDSVTQGLIRYYVRRDLGRQEPRVVVRTVRTVVPEDDPHKVVVTIAFQIVGDPDGRVFSAPIEFGTLSLAV